MSLTNLPEEPVIPVPTTAPTVPTGSPTMRPTLSSVPVRIKVYKDSTSNAADQFWRHRGQGSHEAIKVESDDNSAAFAAAAKFLLEMPSLAYIPAPGTSKFNSISFQSSDLSNNYIRHAGFNVFLTAFPSSGDIDLYQNDASFWVVAALNGKTDYVSFKSENYPNHYIQIGTDNTLDIADNLDTNDKKDSASFKIMCQESNNCPKTVYSYLQLPATTTPAPTKRPTTQSIPVRIQPYEPVGTTNNYFWTNEGITSPALIEIKEGSPGNSASFLLELPSLSGAVHGTYKDSISFHSPNYANYYIRSVTDPRFGIDRLFLDQVPNNPKDASFYIVPGINNINGYVSFMSVNYEMQYIYRDLEVDVGEYLYSFDLIDSQPQSRLNAASFKIICQDSNNCPSSLWYLTSPTSTSN